MLRQRIQDLQHWRKIGLRTAADVDKYNTDLEKRVRVSSQFITDLSNICLLFHRKSPRQAWLEITMRLTGYSFERVEAAIQVALIHAGIQKSANSHPSSLEPL